MARQEQNDTRTRSLIREGMVGRPTSLEVPDKDDARVHCAHSEELGHHWQNDHVFSQADRTGPAPVASSTEVSNTCTFDRSKPGPGVADVNQAIPSGNC